MRPLFFALNSARIPNCRWFHGSLYFIQRILGSADFSDRSVQARVFWSPAWLPRPSEHLHRRTRHLISDSESAPHQCREERTRITTHEKILGEPAASFGHWRFSFTHRMG